METNAIRCGTSNDKSRWVWEEGEEGRIDPSSRLAENKWPVRRSSMG